MSEKELVNEIWAHRDDPEEWSEEPEDIQVRQKGVLTAEEAAEFLGFNPVTIRQKARLGEIPGRKIGREWRFSRRQLLEWLEEGSCPKAHV